MKHVEMIIDYITDGTDFQYSDNHGVLTRCRDCKYYYNTNPERIATANIICHQMHEDDYCSYAERREVSE